MTRKSIIYILFTALIGCIEPYEPELDEDVENLLVVNANINASTNIGEVILSRTRSLISIDSIEYVNNAEVELEHESGNKWIFEHQDSGRYWLDDFNIGIGEKARLNLTIGDDNHYSSNFEVLKETPEIDSITFDSDDQGVQFYVYTHDPKNDTRYYKWDYEEDWMFTSLRPSLWHYDPIEYSFKRRLDYYDTMYFCYKHAFSKDIIIGTSEKLFEDIISKFPFTKIDGTSGKFRHRYSLLVKQRSLNKSTYDYWKLLESNTENVGGLFDPQPFKVSSNILNVSNIKEDVIGYFNLYTETQKRIFVSQDEVTFFKIFNEYTRCEIDTILTSEVRDKISTHYLIEEVREGAGVIGYQAGTKRCMDCRFYGTNKKPDFWD